MAESKGTGRYGQICMANFPIRVEFSAARLPAADFPRRNLLNCNGLIFSRCSLAFFLLPLQ